MRLLVIYMIGEDTYTELITIDYMFYINADWNDFLEEVANQLVIYTQEICTIFIEETGEVIYITSQKD